MKLSIGIVPVSHDTMKKTLQFNNIGFPIIEFSTLMANIYPQDDTYGKKSTNRWQESIAKNDWTAHERSKDWPHPLDSDER